MSDYRRYYVPGGTYFFTLVMAKRDPVFNIESSRTLLGEIFRDQLKSRPFKVVAIVLLPDHLHTVWTLPSGDSDYPLRWSSIKSGFTHKFLASGGNEQHVSMSQHLQRRRGVWQRRYHEHLIEDEEDLKHHVDYLHYNPVKHGYVKSLKDWPWSSFHRYVEEGEYPDDWGRADIPSPCFDRVQQDLVE